MVRRRKPKRLVRNRAVESRLTRVNRMWQLLLETPNEDVRD
jgi:hypothetical protein